MGLTLHRIASVEKLFDQMGTSIVHLETVIRLYRHLLMFHSANIGNRTVSLPETVKGIVDVLQRKLIAENVKFFF